MASTDKRKRIISAAERLFSSRRYHEVTLDEVARRADVAKGTIYLYFQDKEDLFVQVARAGFEEMCGVVQSHCPEDGAFADRLTAVCRAFAAFQQRRRPVWRMVQAEERRSMFRRSRLREMWQEGREHLLRILEDLFRRGAARGEIRSDVAPEALAVYLLALLRGRARMGTTLSEKDRSVDALVHIFLNGIRRG